MNYSDLTDEQKSKVAGKTPEEILDIAKAEGVKLSKEDLDAVAGGGTWDLDDTTSYDQCAKCGSTDVSYCGKNRYICNKCGEVW